MNQHNNFQNSKNQTAQNFDNATIMNQTNTYQYNISEDEMLTFIKKVKIFTQDKPILNIEIHFDNFEMHTENLFKNVKEFIYNPYQFKLEFCCREYYVNEKMYKKAIGMIRYEIENYIYILLERYVNKKIEDINYHKFFKTITSIYQKNTKSLKNYFSLEEKNLLKEEQSKEIMNENELKLLKLTGGEGYQRALIDLMSILSKNRDESREWIDNLIIETDLSEDSIKIDKGKIVVLKDE